MRALSSLAPLLFECWRFAPAKFSIVLALMLASSLVSGVGILMIVPLIMSVGIDLGTDHNDSGMSQLLNSWIELLGFSLNLASVLSLYVLIIFVVTALTFSNTVLSARLRHEFVVHLRTKATTAVFSTQWRYLSNSHTSDFLRLITRQVQDSSYCVHLMLILLSSLVLMLVYVSLSFVISPALTLIALACGLGLIYVVWPINRRIQASGQKGFVANKSLYRDVMEQLAGLKMIKSFGAEDVFLERLENSNREVEAQQVRITELSALTRVVNTSGAALIFAIIFYISIEWLEIPVSNLVILLFIFSRLMPHLSAVQSRAQNLIHQAPSYEDLINLLAHLQQNSECTRADCVLPRCKRQIDMLDLEYSHIGEKDSVFDAISVTIRCNTTVALVGPSGAGKSTLADIIAGLLEPTSGVILIDGHELNQTNRMSWRKQVAYVTQDVYFFHDTVRANLEWVGGNRGLTPSQTDESELWRVLELAGADQFVRSLPQGLDTPIGDRGAKLSGGERQRIALARALLSKPSLLILDEATSALDQRNELKIKDALLRLDGRLTILIISHNPTTIEHAAQKICL